MTESKREIKTVLVEMKCNQDDCADGIMAYDPIGKSLIYSEPKQLAHRCVKCGHEETYSEHYPRIEQQFVDDGSLFGVQPMMVQHSIQKQPQGGIIIDV